MSQLLSRRFNAQSFEYADLKLFEKEILLYEKVNIFRLPVDIQSLESEYYFDLVRVHD